MCLNGQISRERAGGEHQHSCVADGGESRSEDVGQPPARQHQWAGKRHGPVGAFGLKCHFCIQSNSLHAEDLVYPYFPYC